MELYEHQKTAINQMKNGSVLCGGVGSGKSRTALAYYYTKENNGKLEGYSGSEYTTSMTNPSPLYIITTARKRDTKEWEQELIPFLLSIDGNDFNDVKVVIDSWNNIGKYAEVQDAFFIFDEQRVVGKGAWVKAFLKICQKNRWILLSATPGDTWMDYIPVFIANGFYKNRTEFIRRHVVFNRFVKYPKVDHYVEVGRLIKLRKAILVNMKYVKPTTSHREVIKVEYNQDLYNYVMKNRKNPYSFFIGEPIDNASELLNLVREIVNSDPSRLKAVEELLKENPKAIIFYNFDYELEMLRDLCERIEIPYAEWNGHRHEAIPDVGNWAYLVQYMAGAEGWNCTTTNVIIFFSQNYSYRMNVQAAGRIDRLNTPYSDLYYYYLQSKAPIDQSIAHTVHMKKNFNEKAFLEKEGVTWE